MARVVQNCADNGQGWRYYGMTSSSDREDNSGTGFIPKVEIICTSEIYLTSYRSWSSGVWLPCAFIDNVSQLPAEIRCCVINKEKSLLASDCVKDSDLYVFHSWAVQLFSLTSRLATLSILMKNDDLLMLGGGRVLAYFTCHWGLYMDDKFRELNENALTKLL